MKVLKFEDLEIWKLALKITKMVYDLTSKKEFAHDWGLRDQLRRAIVSVSSTIVEGFEKRNNNEFNLFLKMSKGSVGEVRNQLYISLTVGYITDTEFNSVDDHLLELANRIGSLMSYLEKERTTRNAKLKHR